MDEDWGAIAASSKMPPFSLFNKISPEEAAQKESFVDIIVYNRWSKAERRLYQKLKATYIAKKIEKEQINSIEDITDSLNQLALFKTNSDKDDKQIDDLISTLEGMKLRHSNTK